MSKTETYDYIVVGAGAAGCLLANKLSKDSSLSVLVLEAGPMDRNLFIHIPAGVYRVYKNPRINWNYVTEAEAELFQRGVEMPRGKVIGGSTSINSMVYMRGHPLDFDRWADEYQLPEWRFSKCFPYFKKGEASDRGEDEWRGADGPQGVSRACLENPLFDAFLEAGEQSGQGRSEDLNGFKPEGLARLDSTKKDGRRCSAAVAYLKPALGRSNLHLKFKALARRVVIEASRAVGIEYNQGGKTVIARANREVILSGGAINSPHLLMVSGIGPADHLRAVGVPVVHNLPGVGQNLQDHASVIVKYACTKPVTIHTMANPFNKLLAGIQWLANRTGPASSNIWEAGGLVRSNPDIAYPDIQYHFAPVGVEYDGQKIRLQQAFSTHVDLSRPTSTGEITLASGDPTEKPLMNFNYLSTEADQRTLIQGMKKARELIAQPAFDSFRGAEMGPGAEAKTDADILNFLRNVVDTDFHPSCTCKMGGDEMAVVDGELRVHGLAGLRVVDASVMPQITSANLNAPTQMIAARAADFILGHAQYAQVYPRYHFQE